MRLCHRSTGYSLLSGAVEAFYVESKGPDRRMLSFYGSINVTDSRIISYKTSRIIRRIINAGDGLLGDGLLRFARHH
jgi:hypothetical protein